jgi:hypothetical protein
MQAALNSAALERTDRVMPRTARLMASLPASPKKSMESACSETEPEAQDAPSSTANINAFSTRATQSTLR